MNDQIRNLTHLAPTLALATLLTVAVPPSAAAATARLRPCAGEQGAPAEARCGTLRVAENRAQTGGRQIDLKILILPATGPDPSPDPVYVLGGGPGQAVTPLAGPLGLILGSLRERRDLVLVDQRGAGGSHPFGCDLIADDDPGSMGFSFPADRIRDCLESIDADPRYYTTADFVRDLDEVRQWLGHERINLAGGSYGTWAAMVYADTFPGRARSIVAQGVVPPDAAFPAYLARSFQRSLDRLAAQCLADAECRLAYGNIGMKARVVMQRRHGHPDRYQWR